MITHSTLLTEIEHIIYLILFGYPSIIILVKFEERAFWLWNICLVPKRQRNGEFLKDEYRYFVAKIAYRAFQNWGICGWYQKTRKNLLIWERNNIKCRYNPHILCPLWASSEYCPLGLLPCDIALSFWGVIFTEIPQAMSIMACCIGYFNTVGRWKSSNIFIWCVLIQFKTDKCCRSYGSD